MDRPSSESSEEHAFLDAVGVVVCETCPGFIEDHVQLPILYMANDPIYAVPIRAVIRHLIWRFETERLGSGGTGHAEFIDERLILQPTLKLVIDNGLSTTPSHVT